MLWQNECRELKVQQEPEVLVERKRVSGKEKRLKQKLNHEAEKKVVSKTLFIDTVKKHLSK